MQSEREDPGTVSALSVHGRKIFPISDDMPMMTHISRLHLEKHANDSDIVRTIFPTRLDVLSRRGEESWHVTDGGIVLSTRELCKKGLLSLSSSRLSLSSQRYISAFQFICVYLHLPLSPFVSSPPKSTRRGRRTCTRVLSYNAEQTFLGQN